MSCARPASVSPLLAATTLLAVAVAGTLWWPPAATPLPQAYTLPTHAATRPETQILLGQRLDINHVDAAALALLPGIGPALAERIVQHRAQHGAFATSDALLAVSGIGPRVLEKIRPFVTVSD
ncbi:MAG: helix-hairpin-helix domain-containing protein [Deltaproteobacteria bacterium]|nr:helix-hairpin-helix domain-containing protein [Deltaproteobacteria bacterium]